MRGGIILSNRLRAMQEAAENFGEGIDGIRMAQRKMAQEDQDRQAQAEARALQTKASNQQLELGGFQARAAQRQEQDALGLRNDMTALEGLDNGLPAFGPQQPGAEPQYMMKDPNAGLRNRLLASIETRMTGKPVSVADLEARKAEAATKRERETMAFNTDQNKAKADIKETEARTGKLALEEKKIKAELDAITKGGMDPEKAAAVEGKLRGEFINQNKVFMDVRDAWSRVNASGDDAAGDLSLIFNYMKMLDPGSTVREGEFANAQNAASVPDRVLNAYNNALQGTRLSKGQREQFKGQAGKLYETQKSIYTNNAKTYMGLAADYGVNPARVAVDLEGGVQGAQAQAAPAAAGNRDSEAVAWAKANPSDPRAAKILQINGGW
ncbi:MAG TPA: hypothetical protein VK465_08700 [Fibrobacteria bacterium]|nr:hypothetical protein [Geothrix sp.]HLP41570.1 hypothetical protein [Fibrobacteria bacterium]